MKLKRPDVIHVSSAHRWSDNRIHLREAATLARAGYDVHLVAVAHEIEIEPTNVTVTPIAERTRAARVLIGSLQAIWAAIISRAKVVHLHDPELIWGIPLLRCLGRTVVYDAHEDLPSQMADKEYLGALSRRLGVWIARFAVMVAGRTSSHVVAATERIAETFPASKVTIVHNYPPLREAEDAAAPLVERLLAVSYIGAMSRERGSVQMVESFADRAFPEDWRVFVAGTTAPASLLDELMTSPGWARVDFHGVLPPHEARDLLLKSRVGLVLFQKNAAHLESLPTKMFEYLAAGIPVIASDFPLWRTIVAENECGLLVDETSPHAIASAVRQYAEDPALLAKHGENARRVSREKLNWTAEGERLVATYRQLLPQR